jgi:glycerol-3-phosphate cytidylyltransferase-like family protein
MAKTKTAPKKPKQVTHTVASTDEPSAKKDSKSIHDQLAEKRAKLVNELATVDEEIAEAAEKARTGDM